MVFRRVKDSMFNLLVERNPHILKAYQEYKWNLTGKENKLISWSYIILLNVNYRLLKVQNTMRLDKGKNKKQRLPYLKGSESSLSNRMSTSHLSKKLIEYDIVSFDIFDTLILRPFSKPTDLFYLLEQKHKYLNFAKIRKEAEIAARENCFEQNGHYEINIYDIYKIVSDRTGLDLNDSLQLEFELEKELCFANPYMQEVVSILKEHNKKMIVISDMYLPKKMIKSLLEKCGYDFDDIYVSNEFYGSKRHGKLYNIVNDKLNANNELNIIHVGDNYVSDIEQSELIGWNSYYYKNVNNIGNKYRTEGMSRLVSGAYQGLINAQLHNGKSIHNPRYEYGFVYGGLMTLGFCNWIHKYSKERNIDKILFLSRDGDIYYKVYNEMFDNKEKIENEYVFWSRNPGKIISSNISKHEYFKQYIDAKIGEGKSYNIIDVLESMDIGYLSSKLDKYNIHENDILNSINRECFISFIEENWEEIQSGYDIKRQAAKKYFDPILKGCKNVAVVDIGWQGNGIIEYKKSIEQVLKYDCCVSGLMLGYSNSDIEYTTPLFMDGTIATYLWSSQHNRDLFKLHRRRSQNNIFLELFTSAKHPSFKNFNLNEKGQLEFDFDIPEIENYGIIDEVQDGILDFTRTYVKTFKNYEFMMNISGYDAYMPFYHITKNLRFIRKYFGEYSYNMYIGGIKGNEFFNMEKVFKDFKL